MTRKELLIQEAARYIARSQPRDLSEAKTVSVSCNAEGAGDPVDYMVKDGGKQHKYNGIDHEFLALPDPEDDKNEYNSDTEYVASMKKGKEDFQKALVNNNNVPPDHAKAIAQHAHDLHMAGFSGKGYKPKSNVQSIRSQRPFRMNDTTPDTGEPEYFHTSKQIIQEAARYIARSQPQDLSEAKGAPEMTAFLDHAQVNMEKMYADTHGGDVARGTIKRPGDAHMKAVIDHLHDNGYVSSYTKPKGWRSGMGFKEVPAKRQGVNYIDSGDFESFIVKHGSEAHQDDTLMQLLRKLPSRKTKSFTNPYR